MIVIGGEPTGAPVDHGLLKERFVELREAELDRWFKLHIGPDEIGMRATAGQRAFLEHLDDELVLERTREIGINYPSSEVSN